MFTPLRRWLARLARPAAVRVVATLGWDANVHVRVHDVADLRARYPDWESLSRRERLARTRRVAPIHTDRVSNVTVVGLHEHVVDALDPDQSVDLDASHLAVGDDDSTDPATGDTSLNNQIGVIERAASTDGGTSLTTSTLIDTSELNGNTLKEVGLTTAASGGTLLNHALIDPVDKDDDKTVTVDVDLTAQDA